MVSCNSLSVVFGLMLAICMITLAYTSDSNPASNELNEDKRTFFLGSRYGRSPQYSSKARRFSMVPRADRFFLGSRYGKRMDELAQPSYEQSHFEKSSGPFVMSCAYTGFNNFFRCNNANDISDLNNQIPVEENQTTF